MIQIGIIIWLEALTSIVPHQGRTSPAPECPDGVHNMVGNFQVLRYAQNDMQIIRRWLR
jgi:hypothetical protein